LAKVDRLVGAGAVTQDIPQPLSIRLPDPNGLLEYTRFVPAPEVKRAEPVIPQLADIHNSPVTAG